MASEYNCGTTCIVKGVSNWNVKWAKKENWEDKYMRRKGDCFSSCSFILFVPVLQIEGTSL